MRHWRSLLGCAALAALAVASAARLGATPVTFSGTATYDGPYAADSLYAAVLDTAGPTLLALARLPAGTTPMSRPFSLSFDNAATTHAVLVAALLDVDASGFDESDLDNVITDDDILGWYSGTHEPTLLSAAVSHAGLDFALPEGEIRGNVTFESGQTWAEVEVYSVPEMWSARYVSLGAPGPYALRGIYAGEHIVVGWGSFGDVCWGDPDCVNPTVITLGDGEIRTGIDLDFGSTAVQAETWSRIKSLYR